MVHNPIHADEKYELNFVGHVHEKWKFKNFGKKSFMINVGVDVWKFRPVSFDEIMKDFRRWKKNEQSKTEPSKNVSKGEKKKLQSKEVGKEIS